MPDSYTENNPVKDPLVLLYRNGEPAVSGQVGPRFRDICLEKNSQMVCEAMLAGGQKLDRPIRSEAELDEYVDCHSEVKSLLKRLRSLKQRDREPWTKVLGQISEAIEPIENKLILISSALHKHIAAWRQMVLAGQEREIERLKAQAAEKEAEATYSDNAFKQRVARNEAKQLRAEAAKLKPVPVKGLDTEKYYEACIINRQQAALLPEAAIEMEPNQDWFNRETKARIRMGDKFSTRMFRGIELSEHTRMRFHR
jgi:hypothetical protein